ncbi:unnamed protein product [Closterium sp. NIES-54]
MDVWGLAHVNGQGRERYFLLVVDDYMRYTTVFRLRSKGEVPDDLIPWIRAVRLQLHERFHADLPVMRLHSDKGGEFSSDLLRDFCRGEGILQSFTLLASPQQNGIAERRIGLVMEVACTSMIHAAAPHFLWPFAVRYTAHQLNLWPRVSLPETSPTLRWTRKVGNASLFWVWGSRAFVCDTPADKLSAHAIPCVFLGFPPDACGWQFYHPTLHCVIPSQDVMFDESVPFYRLFPYRSAPPPPPPLFLAPGPPPIDPLPPQGPAPSGVSQPGGAESEGVGSRGAEPGGAEPRSVEPEDVELGVAESEVAGSGGAEPRGTASSGGPAGASPWLSPRPEPLSPQQLRKWFAQRTRLWSGAAGAGDSAAGDTGAGGVGVTAGGARTKGTGVSGTGCVGGTGAGGAGAEGTGAGGARAGDTGAVGARAGGTGAGGAGARGAGAGDTGDVDPGAGGARTEGAVSGGTSVGGTVRPRPYLVPLLQQPASLLLAPPYTEQAGGLTEHREPESPPASPVRAICTRRRIPRPRPPSVLGTHAMALRPSSVPLRSASPPSVGGECALGTDVLEDRQEDFECLAAAVPRFASMMLAREGDPDAPDMPTPRSYAEAITGPYSSQWQAAMDAKMASWKSTGTYIEAVPPSRANIVDGMWIFRVKRPPGSPPAFKARYVARGFSQQQGVDYSWGVAACRCSS